jgi:hypothetical protein
VRHHSWRWTQLPPAWVIFGKYGWVSSGARRSLFYQGKEVGKITSEGNEIGKAGCKTEVNNEANQSVDGSLPQQAKWARVACVFYNVVGWDKTGSKPVPFPRQVGAAHVLEGNAGEYELKIIRNNHLARSIKFTVSADGKFDNGIAKDNQLGANRVIVPVQIIDTQDGEWDRNAWKSDSFYGNPLKGFTPAT